jgi:hypothetical protein
MKNLLNTLCFGYLPLGWKRVFRVITFVWVVIFFIRTCGMKRENDLIFLIIGAIGSMLLSYVITGFIKQKKP